MTEIKEAERQIAIAECAADIARAMERHGIRMDEAEEACALAKSFIKARFDESCAEQAVSTLKQFHELLLLEE